LAIQQKDIGGLTGFKRKKPDSPARFAPPQGDGQNFIKFIADRILRYIAITGCICLLAWIGLHYWKINSENERFKYAYNWIYQQNDKDIQKSLQNIRQISKR
jgi:hypothetical protein